MKRVLYDLKIISLCLLALYVVSIGAYVQTLATPGFSLYAAVICLLFAVLSAGAVGLFRAKEWGRQVLIGGNLALAVMFLVLYKSPFAVLISPAYIILALVLALFFSQAQVRARVVQKQGSAWRSILVVDDDETVIKTVRPILMSNGFSVLTAASGEEGLHIAQKQQPDLIILDVIMPRMKGREVCQQLKENSQTQHIPVIFLTAKDSHDDIQAEMEAGAVAHLTKPVNARELSETVLKILN